MARAQRYRCRVPARWGARRARTDRILLRAGAAVTAPRIVDDGGAEHADTVTPFVVAGRSRTSASAPLVVHNPMTGRVTGRVAMPTPEDVEDAVTAAAAVART